VRFPTTTMLGTTLFAAAALAAPAAAQQRVGGATAPTVWAQAPGSHSHAAPRARGSRPTSLVRVAGTGGSLYNVPDVLPHLTTAGAVARIVHGLALAPQFAPPAVQRAIWAANRIVGLPYVYGGGHADFKASGYDCSGTVSFALHGGQLLSSPLDSTGFEGWGASGGGQWITIFANGGHAYMNIAGVRLDTSSADDPSGLSGPRWRPLRHSNAGYAVRHPVGY
jgi:cell wall-associated NlpC family hydrolase